MEQADSTAIDVLIKGKGWVAVNKPAGLLVHESAYSGPAPATALSILRKQLRRKQLHAVHRLDSATSGVLLVAFDEDTAQGLAKQFEARETEKTYLVIVRGYAPAEGEIDRPLPGAQLGSPARPALTRFKTMARIELPIPVDKFPVSRYSLVEVRPETGRHHQIRRHFKVLAHPIIGDVQYGKGDHNRVFRQNYDVHRLMLHAWKLKFRDPATGEETMVEAPVDDSWTRALKIFGDAGRLDRPPPAPEGAEATAQAA
jgi:tRNA pseudouridine65 synthase